MLTVWLPVVEAVGDGDELRLVCVCDVLAVLLGDGLCVPNEQESVKVKDADMCEALSEGLIDLVADGLPLRLPVMVHDCVVDLLGVPEGSGGSE